MDIETYAERHKNLYDWGYDNSILRNLLLYNRFKRMADIGCGNGNLLYWCERNGLLENADDVLAVDLSMRRLEDVSRISEKIRTFQDDAQTLSSIPDDYLDLVVSTQVIEHVPDDLSMLNALDRVMKPGSILYLDTVFKKTWAKYFYRNRYGTLVLDPTHLREYTEMDQLTAKIARTRLRLVFSDKIPMRLSVANYFIRKFNVDNFALNRSRILRAIRSAKVAVPGYFCWRMLLVKA
jgi:2-polyprenyl-3-methyl-5-hydroxy-6-metoxy-1,4-benzoquinol methylase